VDFVLFVVEKEPMFTLKEYQQRALDALRAYFTACATTDDPDTAFYAATKREFGAGVSFAPVKELPGLPYICIRIPTGGGKTLVACHAVSIAARDLLHADHSVVLWLVPSNAIREQTLKALRDRDHPYRQALQATCGSPEVLTVGEALYVTRASLDAQTTIIVSTMQAFRVEDTEGRKVYESAGALKQHFDSVPAECVPRLQCLADGTPIPSLANVLCMRRPIVIVDEAHNARTGLSFETLARFFPSCIIEFTATPDREKNPSNILHSVSAAELKAENMIKMPIRLATRPDWKELLADAVAYQRNLEKLAHLERQKTGEYIRPIVLVQAQPHSKDRDTLSVETVRECLLKDHRVPEDQIAVATGAKNELDGVDILSPDCPVRFVITMQALREGWDCPFAYVLCSVAELKSATYIEQILGRVMRLPRATEKQHEELNVAYAFASSPYWSQVANMLTDALVRVHGFEKQDAKSFILPVTALDTGALFDFMGTTEIILPEAPETDAIPEPMRSKFAFDKIKAEQSRTAVRMTFNGNMTRQERDALKGCFSTEEAKTCIEQAFRRSNALPADTCGVLTREPFSVPGLAVQQGDLFEPFEETHFLDHPWDLRDCDAALTEAEFSAESPKGQHGEIFVTKDGEVKAAFVSSLQQQMALFASDDGWTVGTLVHWLDVSIPHPDITPMETGVFLTRAVQTLMDHRGIPLSRLVHDKFRLRDALTKKIDAYRRDAHRRAFQTLLLPGCETPIVVTPEICFTFNPKQYPFSRRYQGKYQFRKHFYDDIGDWAIEGEEFECAQFIDQLEEVETWVRNLERRPSASFWLQTSTDKFYPDFVCKLKDGRFLVVEYKGSHLEDTPDTQEKRALGELWEARSNGTCLFVMPTGGNFDTIRQKIIGTPQ